MTFMDGRAIKRELAGLPSTSSSLTCLLLFSIPSIIDGVLIFRASMHFVKPNPQLLLLEGRRGVFTLKPMTTHHSLSSRYHSPRALGVSRVWGGGVPLGGGVGGRSRGWGRGWKVVSRWARLGGDLQSFKVKHLFPEWCCFQGHNFPWLTWETQSHLLGALDLQVFLFTRRKFWQLALSWHRRTGNMFLFSSKRAANKEEQSHSL